MSFEHSRPSRRGFTLLEVVCTLIILGVLGGLIFSGFSSALKGYTQMRTSSSTFMQAELALIRLQKELSAAFDEFHLDTDSILFHKADGTSVVISLENGNRENLLLEVEGAEKDAILLNGVSALKFTAHYAEESALPDLITVSFTLKTEVGTRDYTLSVSPRNTPPAKG